MLYKSCGGAVIYTKLCQYFDLDRQQIEGRIRIGIKTTKLCLPHNLLRIRTHLILLDPDLHLKLTV
jgi:hypothetical protein